jgi:hypothetical protein
MSNLRIGYINRADSATLTASPVMTTAGPVTYLQNDRRGDIAQATSASPQDIKGTWSGGLSYTVNQFTLWRHNLTPTDTIRLILYPNTDWTGTPVYDSTALAAYASGLFLDWGWGFYNLYFTPSGAAKSFKVTISASVAAFECSRLFLGPYTEAPVQAGEGFMQGRGTNSLQTRTEGGSLESYQKADWRSPSFDMIVETEAQRAAWSEIARYCGTWKSFVASLYPGAGGTSERDFTYFAKFETHPGEKIATNRYDFSMKLLEL